ncbi:hypothetical protein AA15669_0236 [Saccharibacter floricola DSM 15669]|uniref:Uncharacterized protein n=1 Tax=Saccharibacter floricola DSM 15669 TaxID=1123227 RepID=A0ABQ0NWD5_9PROT|nr:hypothetical protein AA15669_0236 [Saccharibacter floricola DSM 15669]
MGLARLIVSGLSQSKIMNSLPKHYLFSLIEKISQAYILITTHQERRYIVLYEERTFSRQSPFRFSENVETYRQMINLTVPEQPAAV